MFIIGELINGMYKKIGNAIAEKDKKVIQDVAKQQARAGANALDVNCGPLSKNPLDDIKWLIETIQDAVDIPLSIDSTKPQVIEEGLKLAKKKSIINSTSADKEKLDIYLPLALKYKASLIALTMDKKGVPQDKDRRLELAAFIAASCQEVSFPLQDLYLDPVVLPVNVAQAQGINVIEALKEFKLLANPSPKTTVGLSNVSQGTAERSLINRTFLVMAVGAGLDSAILDPLDKDLMDALITAELVLNRQIYCDSFLDAYKKR